MAFLSQCNVGNICLETNFLNYSILPIFELIRGDLSLSPSYLYACEFHGAFSLNKKSSREIGDLLLSNHKV